MAKFKKGDRVRVVYIQKLDIERDIQAGDTAIVLEEDTSPWVRMDKYNTKLFSADNLCEHGHGWFFMEDQLELIKEETSTQKVMTPMQEAIYKVQSLKEIDAVINPIDVITTILKQMIEKEKEKMCEFADKYRDDSCYATIQGGVSSEETTEEFFDRTFNTKEK